MLLLQTIRASCMWMFNGYVMQINYVHTTGNRNAGHFKQYQSQINTLKFTVVWISRHVLHNRELRP